MRLILSLFFIFCFIYVEADDVQSIDYLGIENGLSNNSVRCVYQDRRGFMWFGTYDGLNRYDGYGFKVFRNKFNDPNSLVHNIVSAITGDADNNLWVGTRYGLSVYNDLYGKFSTVDYRPAGTNEVKKIGDVIKDLKIDRANRTLIASEGHGLLVCAKGSFTATQIPLVVDGKETVSYGVQSIRITPGGKVWVFIQNEGLGLMDYRAMKLRLVNKDPFMGLWMETDGEDLWMGGGSVLYRYNTRANRATKLLDLSDGLLSSNKIVSLAMDRSRNLWIGTNGGGVSIYNTVTGGIKYLLPGESNYSLRSGAVYAIYIDHESRKWIGTSRGGVNVVDPQKTRFRTISYEPGNRNSLSGNAVSAFYEDHDSRLWIGTETSGLSIWDRKKNTFRQYKPDPADPASLPDNSVTSITEDAGKNTWISTFSGGVARYDPRSDNFKRYKCINQVTGIESRVVFSLFCDSQRNLWAGTLRQGTLLGALYRFNPETDRFDLFSPQLSDLFTLYEDSKGVFWGGNLSQLVKINRQTGKHEFFHIGFTVRAIFDDRQGNLWIGTEGGGLRLFDRKRNKVVKQYTTDNGLCNNSVLTILDDEKGNLWLSTYSGLSQFNIAARSFKNYYQSDGLQSNQFQNHAALKLRSTELVVGGIKGFNLFQPAFIVPVNNSPKLLLTALTINNTPVEDNTGYITHASADKLQELKVPYDKAVFSFQFTALEYSAPNKIRYSYYMEHWDRSWNDNGNNRTANYTHIDEGSYVFRVRCTNTEGVWSKEEIAIRFIVLPPWYRSWWAYLAYFLLAGSLVYVYLVYRARQTRLTYEVKIAKLDARRKKAEYDTEVALHEKERLEHEQERMINEKEKELNEKWLSFFTNISHEFRTPLTLIINPAKDLLGKERSHLTEESKALKTIYRNARRMLSLVDQLLLFRKADTGSDILRPARLNLYTLCNEVFVCFIQSAHSRNIQYDFHVSNKELEICADREKIEIVLFNLISNALKYTPAGGSVSFSVTEQDQFVVFEIKDTGFGIPEDAGDKIFERFYQANRTSNSRPGFGIGLYLAKQFIQAHDGSISYKSIPGEGTAFYVRVPQTSPVGQQGGVALVRDNEPGLLNELLLTDTPEQEERSGVDYVQETLLTDKQAILIVDDEHDIRQYIKSMFSADYIIYEAENGMSGFAIAKDKLPDLVITDYRMQDVDGIELCKNIKQDPSLSYIPVILLTGSSSSEVKLKSMEVGADDYISKPFENEYLQARVANLLKTRNSLQNYFFNKITLQSDSIVISEEYKGFIDRCIEIVEDHLTDADFDIQALAEAIGMSHSSLYKRVKSISGQSVNAFIRYIRLRKAAELLINSDFNVNQVAFQSGFSDPKYFSKQFTKLFRKNPSEFIRIHRQSFNKRYKIQEDLTNFNKD